jgi:hypothetical protein
MKPRIARPAVLLALLGLTACVDTNHPVADPQTARPDEALSGLWCEESDDGDVTYYHFGLAGGKLPKGIMAVQPVVHKKDGELEVADPMLCFAARLGEKRYLSVAPTSHADLKTLREKGWKPGAAAGYFLVAYSIDDGKLVLRTVDADAKRKMIESGKIEGDTTGQFPKITASTEKLAQWLATPEAEGLFSEDTETLRRVK